MAALWLVAALMSESMLSQAPAEAPEQAAGPECEPGWTANLESCYTYVQDAKTHQDAAAYCTIQGATLAVIGGVAENTFVGSLLPAEEASCWIGRPLNFVGSTELYELPTWIGDCVSMVHGTLGGEKWVEEKCDRETGFVCKKGSRACHKSELGLHPGRCIRNEFKHSNGWRTFAVSHGPEKICVKHSLGGCNEFEQNPNLYKNPVLAGHPVFGHIPGGHCDCMTGADAEAGVYAHTVGFHVAPTQHVPRYATESPPPTPATVVVGWAGGWSSTKGTGVSTISEESGNTVSIVNPLEEWSPIEGTVTGKTISASGKTLAGADVSMTGLLVGKSITWDNGDEWTKIGA